MTGRTDNKRERKRNLGADEAALRLLAYEEEEKARAEVGRARTSLSQRHAVPVFSILNCREVERPTSPLPGGTILIRKLGKSRGS